MIHFPTLGRAGDDLSTGREIKEGVVKDYLQMPEREIEA
jgi:hypothetical protein